MTQNAAFKRSRLIAAMLLGCLVCLLECATAQAAPAWLPATNLSAPGRDATGAVVAMDEAGETVALWARQDENSNYTVQASIRAPGGAFSAPIEISPSSFEPAIAVAPDGEAIAAWRHFDIESGEYVIEAATRPSGGAFSAPLEISSIETMASPQGLQVAINSAGEAVIAWKQKEPSSKVDPEGFFVVASTRSGGAFFEPEIISPTPLVKEADAGGPRVAIDPAGDVAAVWEYFDATNEVIQAARGSAAGGFSEPLALTADGQNAFSAALAIDSAGEVSAVWTRSNGTNEIIEAASAPAGGAFSTPVDLSAAGENAASPQVAMTPAGAATVIWTRSDGANYIVQATSAPAGGAFAEPSSLSASGQSAFDPALALDPAGAATVLWRRSNGTNEIVEGTTAAPGGAYSAAVELSASGQDAAFPSVAMDGEGDATAVWWRSDGANEIVQEAGYDADTPTLGALSIPSQGVVGVPVSFSAKPTDIWPIAATTFDFGDGARAEGSSVSHTYRAAGSYRVVVSATDAAGTAISAERTIAIRPSAEFAIGRISRNRRRGTATLDVILPGPGELMLFGKGVVGERNAAAGPGELKFQIRARGKARRALLRRGKVRVALTISFTPQGGSTTTKHTTVTLERRRR